MKSANINLSIIQEYADHDLETQKDLIKIFHKKTLEDLDKLRKNIIDGHSKEWSETAHSLKGSAGYIGAENLRELCNHAQSMIDVDSITRQALYKKIKDEHAFVCLFLKKEKLL